MILFLRKSLVMGLLGLVCLTSYPNLFDAIAQGPPTIVPVQETPLSAQTPPVPDINNAPPTNMTSPPRTEPDRYFDPFNRLSYVVQIVSLLLALCAFMITVLSIVGYFSVKSALHSIVDDRVGTLRANYSADIERQTNSALSDTITSYKTAFQEAFQVIWKYNLNWRDERARWDGEYFEEIKVGPPKNFDYLVARTAELQFLVFQCMSGNTTETGTAFGTLKANWIKKDSCFPHSAMLLLLRRLHELSLVPYAELRQAEELANMCGGSLYERAVT
jgi:hypothetical protein